MELGFWIAIVSGIPDSPSCIPDSKAWDSGFHKQNFLVFSIWIPQAEISGISDSLTWCDTGQMLFLTNEPAKKAEINILTARDTTGPGY